MAMDENKKNNKGQFLDNFAGKTNFPSADQVEKSQEEPVISSDRKKNAPKRMKKKTPLSKLPKWVYAIIAVLLAVVLGLFIWFSVDSSSGIGQWFRSITVGSGQGDGYPTSIVGSSVNRGNFMTLDKNVVAVSDTALTVMNSSANQSINRQHSFNSPVLQATSGKYLIYNLGGNGFKIEGSSDTIYSGNTNNNIIAGDIAGSGRYALVTEAQGYPSSLSVYLTDNTVQYKYDFSEYYVTDISLNSDGTRAAVSGITAKDGGIVSAVYIFDFSNPEPIAILTYNEVLMEKVEYMDNGTVAAIGDTTTSMINGTTGEKVDYNYQSRQMTDYAIDKNRVALALTPYDNQSASKLVILDSSASEKCVIESQDKIDAVSLYGDTAAILTDSTITGYSASSGNSFSTAEAGSDARGIALADEATVYVLGVSQIRQARFS